MASEIQGEVAGEACSSSNVKDELSEAIDALSTDLKKQAFSSCDVNTILAKTAECATSWITENSSKTRKTAYEDKMTAAAEALVRLSGLGRMWFNALENITSASSTRDTDLMLALDLMDRKLNEQMATVTAKLTEVCDEAGGPFSSFALADLEQSLKELYCRGKIPETKVTEQSFDQRLKNVYINVPQISAPVPEDDVEDELISEIDVPETATTSDDLESLQSQSSDFELSDYENFEIPCGMGISLKPRVLMLRRTTQEYVDDEIQTVHYYNIFLLNNN